VPSESPACGRVIRIMVRGHRPSFHTASVICGHLRCNSRVVIWEPCEGRRMDAVVIILALCSAILIALALVLTQFGLRTLTPLAGASISVPTTAAMFAVISPVSVDLANWHGRSVLLFALAGAFFPVTVTLLTFASNRHLGPTTTGALGNLTPLFAVGLAVVLVGETPARLQIVGILCVALGAFTLYIGRSPVLVSVATWAFALPIGAAFLRGLGSIDIQDSHWESVLINCAPDQLIRGAADGETVRAQ
jgi:uncharacterized membrane protein